MMSRWILPALGLVAWLCAGGGAAAAARLDTALIEEVTGVSGAYDASAGVFRLSLPRQDLRVTVGGATLPAALGLTSWVAFQPVAEQTLMIGELVVREDQVTPVLDAALANALEVTALQHVFVGDTPKVLSMYITAVADTGALAGAIRQVLRAVKAGGAGRPAPAALPPGGNLDAAVLDGILGHKGRVDGGAYTVTVGRPATLQHYPIAGAMGVRSWAAFAGTDAQAAVTGEIAVRAVELLPVLRALRGGGLEVTAIQQHLTMEEPRLFFVRFWGRGTSRVLATAVRGALAAQEK